jgi:hypothetical protein
MKTHRMIVTTNPTDAQVELVFKLLCGALAAVVSQGASFDAVHAEVRDALAGKPSRESTARMVAHAVRVVGGGAVVEQVRP